MVMFTEKKNRKYMKRTARESKGINKENRKEKGSMETGKKELT